MTSVDEALGKPFSPLVAAANGLRAVTGAALDSALDSAPTVAPRAQPSLEVRRLWERRYNRRLRAIDVAVVTIIVAATGLLQLAVLAPGALAHDPFALARVPVLTGLTWLLMLAAFQTRDSRVLGSGAVEYKRVVHATGFAFGLLAIAFIVGQWQGLRIQLIAALPIGLLGLLVGRWLARKWLLRQRRFGHYVSRTLVVGDRSDVEYVIGQLQHDMRNGYVVVGAAVTGRGGSEALTVGGRSYDIVGDEYGVSAAARASGADTIVVASRPAGDPDYVKRLGWQLEGTAAELVLSSRLTDVVGPRMSLRPVEGLPLIHVKIPSFEGPAHTMKRAFDIVVSAVALVAIGTIAPFLALAIKLDSVGPVFFRQTRIGRDGREFGMVKFRSMSVTAEQDLDALRAANEGSGLLFKMKADPRVTRVGRILRKFSLDELPQFWNVFIGDMSIVGPRPPLPSEVTAYDGSVFRRLYIKPGITGLWQVSGRSDLSWEESVRLDLRYVENWSLTNDIMIMWRTVKVMLRPSGAY